ncbi:MAG: rRNA adenine dimethylase [Candidatus Syntrophoarchaeum caldarius]|uniref:rRNA adenine dimethylase n=1 Tax=Candidatus Syntropharchaeum caldarium TaxID=1838285 RepID=A0A1F2P7M0_9EURY|nr:MAG: rRNA adenine dimethylase [Candidatus Syntrophoarchaeum caldarius]
MSRTRRSKLGQHTLLDDAILDRIVEYGEVARKDRVLEIGAGTGNLTARLIERSDTVYAIEIDPELSRMIKARCPGAFIINANALKIELPEFDKVISNLPYSISSNITLKLLRSEFKLGILIYQSEFIQRMRAKPGEKRYGRIAVSVQAFSDIDVLEKVPKSAFYPVPAVHSAIIRLTPHNKYNIKDKALFLDFVRWLFSNRRKHVKKTLRMAGIDPVGTGLEKLLDMRPDELEVPQILEIYEKVIYGADCKFIRIR